LALVLSGVAFGQTAPRSCEQLTKFKVTGAELVIAKAESTLAAMPLPAYCRVDGTIDPRTGVGGKPYGIGFAITLPANWNGGFLFQGGGGLNDNVARPLGAQAAGDVPVLARGFAVVTTDSGHKGTVFDGSFMQDQQAALDFAYAAIGRVTQVAKAIVAQYYGQTARHSYFDGCSTGGREAMLVTQRYPTYFDGVIAGDPAMRTGYSNLADAWITVALNQIAPKDDAGKPVAGRVFSDSDKKLIVNSVLEQCDVADGLKDGMIFNMRACRFDPAVLA
jgi:feruloyl esterase